MKSIRSVSVFVVILFVFIGNIGFNVFTHSCDEDGTINSFIVKVEDHCSDDSSTACCVEDEEIDDCCKDEVTTIKVKFDYFHSDDLQLPTFEFTPLLQPNLYCIEIPEKIDLSKPSPRPPPKIIHGQDLLVLNQVFRI